MKNRIPVAGLIRVSTASQAEDDRAGIDRQREVIERTVSWRGLECVKTIQLTDVSGTKVKDCPEVQDLLDEVRVGRIAGLVVADLDRLIRPADIADLALLQVFQDTGAVIYSGDQEIDLSSDSGYLMGGIQALLAGHELRMIKKRMMGAKEEKRKQGKHPNSHITLPRGVVYDRKRDTYIFTDDVLPVIEAFRLVDEDGITNLCELGRRVGIHHRTLANLLRNPTYKGLRRYDKKRGNERYVRPGGKQADRKKVPREESEIIEVTISEDPPVSPERFDRVQAILDTKKRSWTQKRSLNPVINLGTGVARCDYCGSVLYANSGKRRDRKRIGYYQCRQNNYLYKRESGGCRMQNVRQDQLDAIISTFVATQLSKRGVLKGIIKHSIQTQWADASAGVSNAHSAARSVAAIDRKLAKAYDAYEADVLSLSDYSAKKASLDLERERLVLLKKSMEARSESTNVPALVAHIARGAIAFSRIRSKADKQRVIQGLFQEIRFRDRNIQAFKLMPQFCDAVPHSGSHKDRDSWLPRA
jgi:DNA invertase Pin-like site-specific DNA recombinase